MSQCQPRVDLESTQSRTQVLSEHVPHTLLPPRMRSLCPHFLSTVCEHSVGHNLAPMDSTFSLSRTAGCTEGRPKAERPVSENLGCKHNNTCSSLRLGQDKNKHEIHGASGLALLGNRLFEQPRKNMILLVPKCPYF